jgi:LSD1 subclass zinc finger protein
MPRTDPAPVTPPIAPQNADDVAMLLAFLRERDHPCPRCGYNLRNLTQPVCPECREPLALKVGATAIRIHWLLIAIAPGMFCLIALAIFTIIIVLEGGSGPPPLDAMLVIAFFIASAIGAIVLALSHRRFLRWRDEAQILTAAAIWAAHILAFVIFVATVI